MICFVAILTKRDKIVRRIATNFPAFQMMYMELHSLSGLSVRSAALASVTVAVKHVLTDVVFVVLLTKLIIRANRQWFTSFHGFQTLKIDFCCLNADCRERKQF